MTTGLKAVKKKKRRREEKKANKPNRSEHALSESALRKVLSYLTNWL